MLRRGFLRCLYQRPTRKVSIGYSALRASGYFSTASTSSSPRSKAGWSGLGAFAISEDSSKAWKSIKAGDDEVEWVIERFLHPQESPPQIDWEYWEKTIKHKTIVDCLKSACMQQVELIDNALVGNKKDGELTEREAKDWELFDQAVENCEKAVVASEELVADGAKALWISHRNPPAWTISSDEWLDSDLWWQAYIERHHHFDPAKDVDTLNTDVFESDANDDATRREWKRKVDLFHDRSDTPTLYQYMDQPHSSDYYDIHRRVFLEHMLYYLIRTGNSHHFFPQIPPSDWIAHIEKLRFRWISAAHARRKAQQLLSLSREEPLDLCPLDSELDHHGEDHFSKILANERLAWELSIARLMGDYCFLCHPAIPCTSSSSLYRAVAIDAGRGNLFSLGPDISPLFYVPEGSSPPFSPNELKPTTPLPLESLEQWMSHLGATGASINPGYEDLLKVYGELLQERGQHWFNAPGESVRDAFMRRLAVNDPSAKVYAHYFRELEMLWENAVEIPVSEGCGRMLRIGSDTKDTDMAFGIYCEHLEKEKSGSRKTLFEDLINLQSVEGVDGTLEERGISIIDCQNQQKVEDSERLVKEMKHSKTFTDNIFEAINAVKLPTL